MTVVHWLRTRANPMRWKISNLCLVLGASLLLLDNLLGGFDFNYSVTFHSPGGALILLVGSLFADGALIYKVYAAGRAEVRKIKVPVDSSSK